jgi:hypothetical protein
MSRPSAPTRNRRLRLPTIRIVQTDEVCPPELEEAGRAALLAILRRAFDEEDAATLHGDTAHDATPAK